MSPCPFCGARASSLQRSRSPMGWYVICGECTAAGPPAPTQDDAEKNWNAAGDAGPDVHIEETPELAGARMVLRFRNEELVVVEFVHEDYVQTMRGALTLIGGMRQAEEAEEHGG